jgi:hypothetical protein
MQLHWLWLKEQRTGDREIIASGKTQEVQSTTSRLLVNKRASQSLYSELLEPGKAQTGSLRYHFQSATLSKQ